MRLHRLEAGPVPLHHQVYADLRAALESGTLQPGDRLPPERELAANYGCSLITVRHALAELVREQRIERSRGRGTFVLPPRLDRDIAGALAFAEEMERHGLTPRTRLITARLEPAREAVAAALQVAPDAAVVYLERLRLGDDEPMLLEQVRLPADRFPGLLSFDLETGSLYTLLADSFGMRVVRARESVEPVLLPRREARLLNQRPGVPALVVEGTAYSMDGSAVEVARSYVRGDRTRYYLDRAVDRASWREGGPQPRIVGIGLRYGHEPRDPERTRRGGA